MIKPSWLTMTVLYNIDENFFFLMFLVFVSLISSLFWWLLYMNVCFGLLFFLWIINQSMVDTWWVFFGAWPKLISLSTANGENKFRGGDTFQLHLVLVKMKNKNILLHGALTDLSVQFSRTSWVTHLDNFVNFWLYAGLNLRVIKMEVKRRLRMKGKEDGGTYRYTYSIFI